MNQIKDLTNEIFGYLKVLYRAKDYIRPNGKKYTMWHCKCLNCGNEVDIRTTSLKGSKNHRSMSCGCLKSEFISKNNSKQNKYNLLEEYGVGYTLKGEEFYFDLEDYDKIKNTYWIVNEKGYVVDSTNRKMHQVIMNGKWIDHIDRNKKNNKKSNLRFCNRSQNGMNRDKTKNNTSGHKGVKLYKNKDWCACVRKDGRTFCRYFSINKYGYELAFKMACETQEKLDKELFGEFSIYNKKE